jgi:dolichyl-diphosphooligosaccharide--protein glycosyltransferase
LVKKNKKKQKKTSLFLSSRVNFRATEYLANHGLSEIFTWYDHESWYPLGRTVGTTIYPGLQIVAVWLWRNLNALGIKISLNDTCVFFPAWFGTLATLLLGLLAWVIFFFIYLFFFFFLFFFYNETPPLYN